MRRDEKRYRVIFLGDLGKVSGQVDKLVKSLQVQLGLSAENVAKMMNLAPVMVKDRINIKMAQRYKTLLEEMGATVRIEPMDDGTS